MNKFAQALGRLAKGKSKQLTESERQRRRDNLASARNNRWKLNKVEPLKQSLPDPEKSFKIQTHLLSEGGQLETKRSCELTEKLQPTKTVKISDEWTERH